MVVVMGKIDCSISSTLTKKIFLKQSLRNEYWLNFLKCLLRTSLILGKIYTRFIVVNSLNIFLRKQVFFPEFNFSFSNSVLRE